MNGGCFTPKPPSPPDDDGKCPPDAIKVGGQCVYPSPPGGGPPGGDGGTDSNFGGACKTGFACTGDAVQCATAAAVNRMLCEMQRTDEDVNSTVNKALSGVDGINTDAMKQAASASATGVGSFDVSGFGWSQSCPPDPSISIPWATGGSNQFVIPFSDICGPLGIFSLIGVSITLLGSLVWVVRGV